MLAHIRQGVLDGGEGDAAIGGIRHSLDQLVTLVQLEAELVRLQLAALQGLGAAEGDFAIRLIGVGNHRGRAILRDIGCFGSELVVGSGVAQHNLYQVIAGVVGDAGVAAVLLGNVVGQFLALVAVSIGLHVIQVVQGEAEGREHNVAKGIVGSGHIIALSILDGVLVGILQHEGELARHHAGILQHLGGLQAHAAVGLSVGVLEFYLALLGAAHSRKLAGSGIEGQGHSNGLGLGIVGVAGGLAVHFHHIQGDCLAGGFRLGDGHALVGIHGEGHIGELHIAVSIVGGGDVVAIGVLHGLLVGIQQQEGKLAGRQVSALQGLDALQGHLRIGNLGVGNGEALLGIAGHGGDVAIHGHFFHGVGNLFAVLVVLHQIGKGVRPAVVSVQLGGVHLGGAVHQLHGDAVRRLAFPHLLHGYAGVLVGVGKAGLAGGVHHGVVVIHLGGNLILAGFFVQRHDEFHRVLRCIVGGGSMAAFLLLVDLIGVHARLVKVERERIIDLAGLGDVQLQLRLVGDGIAGILGFHNDGYAIVGCGGAVDHHGLLHGDLRFRALDLGVGDGGHAVLGGHIRLDVALGHGFHPLVGVGFAVGGVHHLQVLRGSSPAVGAVQLHGIAAGLLALVELHSDLRGIITRVKAFPRLLHGELTQLIVLHLHLHRPVGIFAGHLDRVDVGIHVVALGGSLFLHIVGAGGDVLHAGRAVFTGGHGVHGLAGAILIIKDLVHRTLQLGIAVLGVGLLQHQVVLVLFVLIDEGHHFGLGDFLVVLLPGFGNLQLCAIGLHGVGHGVDVRRVGHALGGASRFGDGIGVGAGLLEGQLHGLALAVGHGVGRGLIAGVRHLEGELLAAGIVHVAGVLHHLTDGEARAACGNLLVGDDSHAVLGGHIRLDVASRNGFFHRVGDFIAVSIVLHQFGKGVRPVVVSVQLGVVHLGGAVHQLHGDAVRRLAFPHLLHGYAGQLIGIGEDGIPVILGPFLLGGGDGIGLHDLGFRCHAKVIRVHVRASGNLHAHPPLAVVVDNGVIIAGILRQQVIVGLAKLLHGINQLRLAPKELVAGSHRHLLFGFTVGFAGLGHALQGEGEDFARLVALIPLFKADPSGCLHEEVLEKHIFQIVAGFFFFPLGLGFRNGATRRQFAFPFGYADVHIIAGNIPRHIGVRLLGNVEAIIAGLGECNSVKRNLFFHNTTRGNFAVGKHSLCRAVIRQGIAGCIVVFVRRQGKGEGPPFQVFLGRVVEEVLFQAQGQFSCLGCLLGVGDGAAAIHLGGFVGLDLHRMLGGAQFVALGRGDFLHIVAAGRDILHRGLALIIGEGEPRHQGAIGSIHAEQGAVQGRTGLVRLGQGQGAGSNGSLLVDQRTVIGALGADILAGFPIIKGGTPPGKFNGLPGLIALDRHIHCSAAGNFFIARGGLGLLKDVLAHRHVGHGVAAGGFGAGRQCAHNSTLLAVLLLVQGKLSIAQGHNACTVIGLVALSEGHAHLMQRQAGRGLLPVRNAAIDAVVGIGALHRHISANIAYIHIDLLAVRSIAVGGAGFHHKIFTHGHLQLSIAVGISGHGAQGIAPLAIHRLIDGKLHTRQPTGNIVVGVHRHLVKVDLRISGDLGVGHHKAAVHIAGIAHGEAFGGVGFLHGIGVSTAVGVGLGQVGEAALPGIAGAQFHRLAGHGGAVLQQLHGHGNHLVLGSAAPRLAHVNGDILHHHFFPGIGDGEAGGHITGDGAVEAGHGNFLHRVGIGVAVCIGLGQAVEAALPAVAGVQVQHLAGHFAAVLQQLHIHALLLVGLGVLPHLLHADGNILHLLGVGHHKAAVHIAGIAHVEAFGNLDFLHGIGVGVAVFIGLGQVVEAAFPPVGSAQFHRLAGHGGAVLLQLHGNGNLLALGSAAPHLFDRDIDVLNLPLGVGDGVAAIHPGGFVGLDLHRILGGAQLVALGRGDFLHIVAAHGNIFQGGNAVCIGGGHGGHQGTIGIHAKHSPGQLHIAVRGISLHQGDGALFHFSDKVIDQGVPQRLVAAAILDLPLVDLVVQTCCLVGLDRDLRHARPDDLIAIGGLQLLDIVLAANQFHLGIAFFVGFDDQVRGGVEILVAADDELGAGQGLDGGFINVIVLARALHLSTDLRQIQFARHHIGEGAIIAVTHGVGGFLGSHFHRGNMVIELIPMGGLGFLDVIGAGHQLFGNSLAVVVGGHGGHRLGALGIGKDAKHSALQVLVVGAVDLLHPDLAADGRVGNGEAVLGIAAVGDAVILLGNAGFLHGVGILVLGVLGIANRQVLKGAGPFVAGVQLQGLTVHLVVVLVQLHGNGGQLSILRNLLPLLGNGDIRQVVGVGNLVAAVILLLHGGDVAIHRSGFLHAVIDEVVIIQVVRVAQGKVLEHTAPGSVVLSAEHQSLALHGSIAGVQLHGDRFGQALAFGHAQPFLGYGDIR